ncbi:MAG: MFS transporter [Alphaproteobacteria bacterium]|nr:MFS transporter [Alphaproteobacteria bacterium]
MTAPGPGPSAPGGGRASWSAILVAIAGFSAMLVSGAVWGSFSLFLVAIERDTGWSKTAISLAFTVFTLAGTLAVPVIGLALGRFGSRIVVAVLGTILALGLALGSLSRDPVAYYLTFGLVGGIGSQACGTYVLFIIAANWFRRQATAMAFMDSGSGIGTLIALPLLQEVIAARDWRSAYVALAIAAVAVLLPLSALLRLSPEPMAPRQGESASLRAGIQAILGDGLLRWLAVIFLTAPLAYHAINAHQIAFMQEGGLDADLSVAIVSAMGLTFFFARLALGALIDAKGIRFAEIVIALAATAAVGILLAVATTSSETLAVVYPIVFAIGYSSTGIIYAATARAMVQGAAFTVVYATLRLIYGLGVAFGPPLTALIAEGTGNYVIAFVVVWLIVAANHGIFIAVLTRHGRR